MVTSRRLLPIVLAMAALLLGLLATPRASAHGMRTGYVEIHETASGARVTRATGEVHVVLPPGPLAGATISVEGLGGVVSEAVVDVTLADGTHESQLLRAGHASWTIPPRPAPLDALLRYARAGFVHVLCGADHLLFLAALVVALRRFRAVVLAETAFTLSHSIAFTATALGWLHVPTAAAEAAIALSLVLVALDVGRKPVPAMAGARAALVFGAVHGLGFAGGLEELGVPRRAVGPALAGFAAGVEVAQVLFLLVCFALFAVAKRPLRTLTTYAVGVAGTFWLIERTVPLLH
ncbi:MAG: HupE/UreJ family protein [Labilithrix sp.]